MKALEGEAGEEQTEEQGTGTSQFAVTAPPAPWDLGGDQAEIEQGSQPRNSGWIRVLTKTQKRNERKLAAKTLCRGPSHGQDCQCSLHPVSLPKVKAQPKPKAQPKKRIEITVDSGAVDTVVPPGLIGARVVQTAATKAGFAYKGADGSDIPHLGQQVLEGTTETNDPVRMTVQVAKITKPLASVKKMTQAGNRVVFDGADSYIEHKQSGRRTKIHEREGTYAIDLWVSSESEEEPADLLVNDGQAASSSQDGAESFLRHT